MKAGLSTLLLAWGVAAHAQEPEVPEGHRYVIAAYRDLAQGRTIVEEDLFAMVVPEAMVDEDRMLTSADHVVGRVPRERILASELIAPSMLADRLGGPEMEREIPRGMRALAIDATAPGLRARGYVDVMWTSRAAPYTTCAALESVYVLGVAGPNGAVSLRDDPAPSGATRTILAVVPSQALDLLRASQTGTLSLTLRNATDIEVRNGPTCEGVRP